MYICSECNSTYKKWFGQCPKCRSWNTISEGEQATVNNSKSKHQAIIKDVLDLSQISIDITNRDSSGNEQLDLVLGGGFVKGSLTLLGGKPGIGKSTLILKLADHLQENKNVLYVSGEENLSQIKLRANRLNVKSKISFLNEQNSHDIMATALDNKIDFLIIDSIQTTASPEVGAASGSVSQLKTIALEMMNFAKKNDITTVLIGHVTKDGDIAGPKLLEHMVDTVVYIEAEGMSGLRIIRAEKNRFGTTSEIGILKMTNDGLVTADDTSRIEKEIAIDGTAFTTIKIGGRQMYAEVQSLVTPSPFPSPKRSSQGVEMSRLNIALAILQKHCRQDFTYDDVYVKLRGGLKNTSNEIDLPLLVSIYSAKNELPVDSRWLFVGEVTLTGEILPVEESNAIVKAAVKLGYKKIYLNSSDVANDCVNNVSHIGDVIKEIRR